MQKQLVLAALFATVNAADCTDANVVMAKASKAALTAATAGLTTAKAAALAAQGLSNTAQVNATADVTRWTTAMSAFTTEQTLAVNRASAQVTVASNAKAALDAIQVSETLVGGGACSTCVAANALLPLKIASVAKTAADLVVSGTGGVTLNAKNTAAGTIVTELLANKVAHDTVKQAMELVRTNAKQSWDDSSALNTAALAAGEAVYDAKLKFSVGNIMVLGVTSKKTESLRKCNGTGIGYQASGAGTIWNTGSHNNTTGAANANDAAKEYKDNYLDCATIGYTTIVTAKKLISGEVAGTNTTYLAWFNAQAALEEKAYIFGKLLHTCMAGATFINTDNFKAVAATPCLRSGRFERTYSAAYAGKQGKPAATIAVTAVSLTGKKGDYAADGLVSAVSYTSTSAIAPYVKAIATTSGVGTVGTSLFATRDTAYTAWLVKVGDTADAILTENIATIEYRKLQLLGTAYVLALVSGGNTKLDAAGLVKTASLAAVGTEARTYELALNKKVQDGIDLGVGADRITGLIAAAASKMAVAPMVALGALMVPYTSAITVADMKTKNDAVIAAATLKTLTYLQACRNFETANAKLVQATADHDRAVTAQGLITTAITAAKTDATIKNWQFDNENAKYNTANTANTVAQALKTKLDEAKALSDTIGTKANIKGDFYKDVETKAKAMQTVSNTAFSNASAALATNGTDITAATGRETLAISQCKAVGYKRAQDALSKINAAKTTDAAAAKTTKTAYDTLSARPASTAEASVAGSDCSYGAVVDGTPAPRSKCAEGLCCGAANKYLRDGTKLTVETCQKTDVISYTFYPQLKAGATVAPVAEQWRFSCISGAKNLAATATAALAAAYLMA